MPVLREEGIENNEVGNGMAYDMFGGSADATLVMSEWVETADYGWTKVLFWVLKNAVWCDDKKKKTSWFVEKGEMVVVCLF